MEPLPALIHSFFDIYTSKKLQVKILGFNKFDYLCLPKKFSGSVCIESSFLVGPGDYQVAL
jgi:hypothetical protein